MGGRLIKPGGRVIKAGGGVVTAGISGSGCSCCAGCQTATTGSVTLTPSGISICKSCAANVCCPVATTVSSSFTGHTWTYNLASYASSSGWGVDTGLNNTSPSVFAGTYAGSDGFTGNLYYRFLASCSSGVFSAALELSSVYSGDYFFAFAFQTGNSTSGGPYSNNNTAAAVCGSGGTLSVSYSSTVSP